MDKHVWCSVLAICSWVSSLHALNVSVYYEALCGDSISFVANQLAPHYSELADYIDLELVPYGKALHSKENGTWKFDCQHGPSECIGNKYQSCVLAHGNGAKKDVEFLGCIVRKRNPSLFGNVQSCASGLNLNVTRIQECAKSDEANELLAKNGDKTWKLEPSISFVPTIIYDGVYQDDSQWQSIKDFVAVVCDKIMGEKPSICANKKLPETGRSWWNWRR